MRRRSLPPAVVSWWGENRDWARPVGCLALFLPAMALASCAGAVAAVLFGALKLGTSLRKRE